MDKVRSLQAVLPEAIVGAAINDSLASTLCSSRPMVFLIVVTLTHPSVVVVQTDNRIRRAHRGLLRCQPVLFRAPLRMTVILVVELLVGETCSMMPLRLRPAVLDARGIVTVTVAVMTVLLVAAVVVVADVRNAVSVIVPAAATQEVVPDERTKIATENATPNPASHAGTPALERRHDAATDVSGTMRPRT